MNIQGRKILITGTSRGIGKVLAQRLAPLQPDLILVQRHRADSFEQSLLQAGAMSVRTLTCDLAYSEQVDALCKMITNLDIDVLVNNAGVLTGGLLENQLATEISAMIQVNLTSLILLTRAALPSMLRRKTGLVVNNASVSAVMRFPCATTYAAGKAGVLAFSDCLATELSGTGVKVLTLLTPSVSTEMYQEIPKKYGQHFTPPTEKSLPPRDYADAIIKAIERDESLLLPRGRERMGLWLAKYLPKLFLKFAARDFHRE